MIVILRILITVFWAVFEKKDIYTSKARFLYQGHSPARPMLLLITISIQTNLQFGLLTQLQCLGKLCSKREKYRALTGKYRAIMWRNIVQSMQRQGIYWPQSNALMHTLMTPPCQIPKPRLKKMMWKITQRILSFDSIRAGSLSVCCNLGWCLQILSEWQTASAKQTRFYPVWHSQRGFHPAV